MIYTEHELNHVKLDMHKGNYQNFNIGSYLV